MNTSNYLKGIEKKAWEINYRDGLFDLYFGFLLIGNATASFIDIIFGLSYAGTISFMIVFLIGMVIVSLGKHFISTPRIGKICVGPLRLKRLIILNVIIGIAIASTFLLWFLPENIGITIEKIPIIPIYFFIFIGAIFSAIAYLLDYKRGYVIALISALSWGLNEGAIFYVDSRIPGAVFFAIGGILIIGMGMIVFSRFLKEYPFEKQERNNFTSRS